MLRVLSRPPGPCSHSTSPNYVHVLYLSEHFPRFLPISHSVPCPTVMPLYSGLANTFHSSRPIFFLLGWVVALASSEQVIQAFVVGILSHPFLKAWPPLCSRESQSFLLSLYNCAIWQYFCQIQLHLLIILIILLGKSLADIMEIFVHSNQNYWVLISKISLIWYCPLDLQLFPACWLCNVMLSSIKFMLKDM